MAKSKNGKAKRAHQKQQVVSSAPTPRKNISLLSRWASGFAILLMLVCCGFAATANRHQKVEHTEGSSSAHVQLVDDAKDKQTRSIDDEDVDPKTWRDLNMVMSAPDGKVEIGLLRPEWWVEQVGAQEGKTINLTIPEMKMAGPTKIISLKRMKGDKVGGAGTVTGTFKHTASDILNLQLQGEKKLIGVTPAHPFRSADRNVWVGAGQLKIGERVMTRNGTTKVVAVSHRAGSAPVYNLEVHGTHTYFVGTTGGGAWVHNDCAERVLEADELGVTGEVTEFSGTFSVTNGIAKIKVNMIEGNITNPLQVIGNLKTLARDAGATKLRIEAILANPELDQLLRRRYKMQTINGVDVFELDL